ncbi:hypothetical protein SEUCBS139899_002173 [Sporothrix eucalyptigena]|uniref:Uncharacterized protein n=1 Tax=Sporothrix eucalyptigena TaxID=1812306 RepID=A0ABP0B4N9_9PEZI
MGTAEEAEAQPREEDDDVLPSYPGPWSFTDPAQPPAYDPGEGPSRVSSLLISTSPDDAAGSHTHLAADDLLAPVVLVLDGQAIYAASDPASVHLYEVNRGITSLTNATTVVEFARMEPRPNSSVPRSRHIYNLHHPPPSALTVTMTPFEGYFPPASVLANAAAAYNGFFIQPTAAPTRNLGPLGLKKKGITSLLSSTAPVDHWTVSPVDLHGWAEVGHPPYVADGVAFWDVRQVFGGAVKWVDSGGKDVAMEFDDERAGDEGKGKDGDWGEKSLPRLVVTASLRRELMDTLVAMWCCRLWEKSVVGHRGQQVVKTKSIPTGVYGWKKLR